MNKQTTHLTKESLKLGTNKDEMPTHLDLFSGIGGFALAAGWAGFETIGFCDNEPYAQAVLKKHWPNVPCHKDIREVRGELYAGVTLLTGGFPCQPFSNAGKRRGKDDDRYLWPQMLRVIQEAKPAWIVGENVAGIIGLALDQVYSDLEACGYEVEPIIIPACGVDAPHRRNRVWIMAYSKCYGFYATKERRGVAKTLQKKSDWESESFNTSGTSKISCSKQNVADSGFKRHKGHKWQGEAREKGESEGHASKCCGWSFEPELGRVANGILNRAHRIKGLGNAIVPQVAYQIIKGIRDLL